MCAYPEPSDARMSATITSKRLAGTRGASEAAILVPAVKRSDSERLLMAPRAPQ